MSSTTAAAVANWFLDRAQRDGLTLDQLQIQKLLYYANGWYLAHRDAELFSEDILAWPHGPVINDIWYQFRDFGRGPIRGRAEQLQLEPGDHWNDAKYVVPSLTDSDREAVCEQVWQKYGRGRFSGVQLSNMTHEKGEPWEIARRFCCSDERPPIPSNIIRDAFKQKLDAARAAT